MQKSLQFNGNGDWNLDRIHSKVSLLSNITFIGQNASSEENYNIAFHSKQLTAHKKETFSSTCFWYFCFNSFETVIKLFIMDIIRGCSEVVGPSNHGTTVPIEYSLTLRVAKS